MQPNQSIRTRAPGKLLLLGEYAVLEGAPAIVTAVDRDAWVNVAPAISQNWTLTAAQLGLHAFALGEDGSIPSNSPPEVRKTLTLFTCVLDTITEQVGPLPSQAVSIDTSAFFHGPEKLGIGSSAAVAVALTGALLARHGRVPEQEELFTLAAQAHNRAQGGVGSNVDIAASVYGGTLVHRIGELPEPIILPSGLTILPVFAGYATSTANLVSRVFNLRDKKPQVYAQHLQNLTEVAKAGCLACTQNDATQLLQLANAYHQGMQALGEAAGADIISAVHKNLFEFAAQHNATYKPSGAGGGDIGLLFSKATTNPDALAQALREQSASQGFEALALKLGAPGFQVM